MLQKDRLIEIDVDKVTEPEGNRPEKMASAVFSISYNFIPNGDMFGILDNISELSKNQ